MIAGWAFARNPSDVERYSLARKIVSTVTGKFDPGEEVAVLAGPYAGAEGRVVSREEQSAIDPRHDVDLSGVGVVVLRGSEMRLLFGEGEKMNRVQRFGEMWAEVEKRGAKYGFLAGLGEELKAVAGMGNGPVLARKLMERFPVGTYARVGGDVSVNRMAFELWVIRDEKAGIEKLAGNPTDAALAVLGFIPMDRVNLSESGRKARKYVGSLDSVVLRIVDDNPGGSTTDDVSWSARQFFGVGDRSQVLDALRRLKAEGDVVLRGGKWFRFSEGREAKKYAGPIDVVKWHLQVASNEEDAESRRVRIKESLRIIEDLEARGKILAREGGKATKYIDPITIAGILAGVVMTTPLWTGLLRRAGDAAGAIRLALLERFISPEEADELRRRATDWGLLSGAFKPVPTFAG